MVAICSSYLHRKQDWFAVLLLVCACMAHIACKAKVIDITSEHSQYEAVTSRPTFHDRMSTEKNVFSFF